MLKMPMRHREIQSAHQELMFHHHRQRILSSCSRAFSGVEVSTHQMLESDVPPFSPWRNPQALFWGQDWKAALCWPDSSLSLTGCHWRTQQTWSSLPCSHWWPTCLTKSVILLFCYNLMYLATTCFGNLFGRACSVKWNAFIILSNSILTFSVLQYKPRFLIF